MASTCCQPIAHSYPHISIWESGFQFSKPPTSSDALLLGSAARFNLSAMDVPALMNAHLFQAAPHCRPTVRLRGQALRGEIFDPTNFISCTEAFPNRDRHPR